MFKKTAALCTAGVLFFFLSGCSLWASLTGDDQAASERAAAYTVLTTYADTYQPAVIAYGQLPTCSDSIKYGCKTSATLSRLIAIDKSVATTAVALQTILENSKNRDATDTRQTVVSDTQAIEAAIAEIAGYSIIATVSDYKAHKPASEKAHPVKPAPLKPAPSAKRMFS